MSSDDRRKLDRTASGNQPPAPVARPTPPEQLPSRSVVVQKTIDWLTDHGRPPREVVARALRQFEVDRYGTDEPPYTPWEELDSIVQDDYLTEADAALDAVAPLLRGPLFRSVAARRDAELRHALSTVQQLNDQLNDALVEQLRTDAKLQRYREAVRALARIVQRKRAGANREVARLRRQVQHLHQLLRRRIDDRP
jgi:hypothetical protein